MAAHDTGALRHGVSRDKAMPPQRALSASSASSGTTHEHVAMAPLLTPKEVSKLLGIPPGTLANWRYQGHGPAFVRLGRHVRYRACDVNEWVESRLARDGG